MNCAEVRDGRNKEKKPRNHEAKSMFYRLRDLKLFEPRDIDEYIVKLLGNIGGEL